jgi:hypothetical protein
MFEVGSFGWWIFFLLWGTDDGGDLGLLVGTGCFFVSL